MQCRNCQNMKQFTFPMLHLKVTLICTQVSVTDICPFNHTSFFFIFIFSPLRSPLPVMPYLWRTKTRRPRAKYCSTSPLGGWGRESRSSCNTGPSTAHNQLATILPALFSVNHHYVAPNVEVHLTEEEEKKKAQLKNVMLYIFPIFFLDVHVYL